MKKYLKIGTLILLTVTLSSCGFNVTKHKETATNETLSSKEMVDFMKGAEESIKEAKKREQEAKQIRLDLNEPKIEITGKVLSTLTKPDSDSDFYQIDVEIQEVNQDVNKLYNEPIGKEYTYFVVPSEYPDIDFNTLKEGSIVKISTFKDSVISDSEYPQVQSSEVTGIEILNK